MKVLVLLLLIPAWGIVILALIHRFAIRRRPFGLWGWIVSVSLAVMAGFAVPLKYGVWLPDVFGKQHTLCSATASTGHRINLVQYWNHIDFYTLEARITKPDGITSVSTLDGDASKIWKIEIEIDPSQTSATYRYAGRTGSVAW